MKSRVAWLCGGVLAGLASAPSAWADGGDPAAAEALFRQARHAVESGDYPAACPKFAESQRLDPASGTLFNLADCEEHVGKLASAWEHFARVAEALPPSDERREYARAHAAALERRLPHLTLVLAPDAPPGTQVTRDGVELGAASLDTAVPVNPGAHAVLVVAPGRPDRAYPVSLAEGQVLKVVVAAAPPGEGTAAPPADRTDGSRRASVEAAPTGPATSGTRVAGDVALGVGGAVLVAGAVFGGLALSQRSESNGDCQNGACRDQGGVTAYDHAKTSARIADVCFGAGVLAVALGGYLVLTSRVDVTPSATARGGGVQVRVAW